MDQPDEEIAQCIPFDGEIFDIRLHGGGLLGEVPGQKDGWNLGVLDLPGDQPAFESCFCTWRNQEPNVLKRQSLVPILAESGSTKILSWSLVQCLLLLIASAEVTLGAEPSFKMGAGASVLVVEPVAVD